MTDATGRLGGAAREYALTMLGLRRSAGLLTKEERLVFLTVSLCLLGGGLFRACLSLFDLPDVLDPRAELASPFDGETGAGVKDDESRSVASAGGDGENVAGLYETAAATGAIPVERGAPGTKAAGGGGRLELNAATQAELEELPGIGPALAARILEHRSRVGGFKSVEDLLDVSGIGEKTLSRFRPYVYVSPSGT